MFLIKSDAARTHPFVVHTPSVTFLVPMAVGGLSGLKCFPVLSSRLGDDAPSAAMTDCSFIRSSLTRCCAVGEEPDRERSPIVKSSFF